MTARAGRAAGPAELPAVCILAGGRGTRLGERARDVPKPLVEVAGEPFLFHPLRRLAGAGFTQVVLCVGYRGAQVEEVVGTVRFGMEVAYSYDNPGLEGTLGALRRARPLLGERFLVLYGDTILTLDYGALLAAWAASGQPAVMAVWENAGRLGLSNAEVRGGLVVAHDKVAPTVQMTWIDYGVGGMEAGVLDAVDPGESDLSTLYGALAAAGRLAAFPVTERFYEIGTPAALAETEAHLATHPPRPSATLGAVRARGRSGPR